MDLPQRLAEIFGGRRIAAADPPDFLNPDLELILIAAATDVESEDETAFSAEIFSELKLRRSEHPVVPPLEG